eukprot:6234860-Prymnesium_polylepis.2
MSSSTTLVLFDDDDDDDGDGSGGVVEGATADEVTIEVERWKSMSLEMVNNFKDKETGIVNEFALLWAMRKDFPLHYFVFRQTASHLPHEGK